MSGTGHKGVSCVTRKDVQYWYAYLDGKKKYCGKGTEGKALAEAAKGKERAKRYEEREAYAGLKVKRYDLRTVKDLANWYMILPSIQEQRSYDRKVDSATHLLRSLGNKSVYQVEGDIQERYRADRKSEGAAEGTINLEISLLSAMYHLALRRKKIDRDAMPGEFVIKEDRRPRRIIKENEYEGILDHANPAFRDVLICAYESAMRSGEIIDLRANQVHLGVQHISGDVLDYIDLGEFDTKTKTRRTVPVSPILKEVLKRRLKGLGPDGHVFPGLRGKKYFATRIISQMMKEVCERAGVLYGDKLLNDKGERIGVVFHCFRHTRTTRWVEMGFSDEIIRRATGHKSLATYRNYVKITDARPIMRLVREQIPKKDNSGTKRAESQSEQAT